MNAERWCGADWAPPRCSHGYILLGCPHYDCPEQNRYLDEQDAALASYYDGLLPSVTVTDDALGQDQLHPPG